MFFKLKKNHLSHYCKLFLIECVSVKLLTLKFGQVWGQIKYLIHFAIIVFFVFVIDNLHNFNNQQIKSHNRQ